VIYKSTFYLLTYIINRTALLVRCLQCAENSAVVVSQIAGLRKHLTRLRGQANSRKDEIEATLGRLTQFTDSLQTTTEKIDDLVDAVASKLSQPIADDVQAIQRDQQLFDVSFVLALFYVLNVCLTSTVYYQRV